MPSFQSLQLYILKLLFLLLVHSHFSPLLRAFSHMLLKLKALQHMLQTDGFLNLLVSQLSLSLSLSLSPRITVKDWYIELLTKKGEDGCVVLKIVILVKMQQKSRDKYNIYIYIFYHSNVNCSWPLFWSQFERLWNPSGSYAYWIWEMLLSRTGMMLNWTPAISFFFFLQAHDEPKVDFDCQLYDNRISIY
jgi:hypothetical protein